MTLVNRIEIAKSLNHTNEYFFVELNDATKVNEFIDDIKSKYTLFEVRISTPKSNITGNVGIQLVISDLSPNQINELINYSNLEYVTYFIQSY